jgi:preprotein translocase subunit SecB
MTNEKNQAANPNINLLYHAAKRLSIDLPGDIRSPMTRHHQTGMSTLVTASPLASPIPFNGSAFRAHQYLTVAGFYEGENDPAFSALIYYSGVFLISDFPIDEVDQKRLLLVDCQEILFPYARQVLSGVVVNAGFPPPVIEPFDFEDMLNEQSQKEQEELDATAVEAGHVAA